MDLTLKQFSNKAINLKLDETNYMQWKQQICCSIASHRLEGYLDGSTQLEEMIINDDRSKIVNLAYKAYKEQDSGLASWLLTSISTSLLPNLVQCRTTYEIW